MTRVTKTLLCALIAGGLSTTLVADGQAFGGQNGQVRRAARRASHTVVVSRPVYVTPPPVQTQVVPQIVYVHVVPAQPVQTQTASVEVVSHSQSILTPATAAPSAAMNPQLTALEMIADFAGAPAASSAQRFNGIGKWMATLPNSAAVQLNLQADGTFVWTALSNGKQSTFRGNYRLTETSLTLVRSDDNKTLDGSITLSGEGSFLFKLNGTQDSGLRFSRG